MSERNVVQRVFDDFGRAIANEKKSGNWYRRSSDVIEVLNLQKSQYAKRYYFNLGFWLTALGDDRYPKAPSCHVVLRLNDAVPKRDRRIDELLDLEHHLDPATRSAELRLLLDSELLPLLKRAESIDGLSELVRTGPLAHAGVRGPAQTLLIRGPV